MPDWSIKIIPNPSQGQPPLLLPDVVGAKPGDPLQTQQFDLVSWSNQTNQSYQPWPTDQNGNVQTVGGQSFTPPFTPQTLPPPMPWSPPGFLTNMIPNNLSSTPAYEATVPASGNIVYYCLLDGNGNPTTARGQIIVSPMPQALNIPKIGRP